MQLCAVLHAGDAAEAMRIVEARPDAARVRDDASGGFPIHIAAFHNLGDAAASIARNVPGAHARREMRHICSRGLRSHSVAGM